MTKSILSALGFVLASATLLACSGHYSTQEAYDICREHESRNPAGFTEESFASCVACYEDCGTDCAPGVGFPVSYDCPD